MSDAGGPVTPGDEAAREDAEIVREALVLANDANGCLYDLPTAALDRLVAALAAEESAGRLTAEKRAAAEAEAARYREALERWTRHSDGCAALRMVWRTVDGRPQCDCGLDSARAALGVGLPPADEPGKGLGGAAEPRPSGAAP